MGRQANGAAVRGPAAGDALPARRRIGGRRLRWALRERLAAGGSGASARPPPAAGPARGGGAGPCGRVLLSRRERTTCGSVGATAEATKEDVILRALARPKGVDADGEAAQRSWRRRCRRDLPGRWGGCRRWPRRAATGRQSIRRDGAGLAPRRRRPERRCVHAPRRTAADTGTARRVAGPRCSCDMRLAPGRAPARRACPGMGSVRRPAARRGPEGRAASRRPRPRTPPPPRPPRSAPGRGRPRRPPGAAPRRRSGRR